MKALKKITTFALIAALSVASVFTAMAASEKTAYSFTYEKQQVTPGEAASGALKKLGDYDKKQTLANCADSSGTATAYTYDAFDVITQKVDGKEIVKEITITKASVSTEEGLKVGDTPSKVKELYKDAKGELGLYTVKLGNTNLIIDCGLNDDKVVAITYEYVAEAK